MASEKKHKKQDVEISEQLQIVGIGASAGGLEALRTLVAQLPQNNDACYIVAQHLSPQYRSMMVELLARETTLTLAEAKNNMPLQGRTIYITPPNKDVFVSKNKLRLRKPQTEIGPKPSVDYFFASLAKVYGERAIGIILSGTGSDGTQGVRAIKAVGGITIAQEPESAKYDGMPNSAIRSGAVDLVLTPEAISATLPSLFSSARSAKPLEQTVAKDKYVQLLNLLAQQLHIDFSQYKESTLKRQINRRLAALQLVDLDSYLEFAKQKPSEFELLAQSFLISVTAFFRDPAYFAKLREYLEQQLSKKSSGSEIRVWVPGCATGEEAYSIAILLVEVLGERLRHYDIKIFATDLDNTALEHARRGLYPETSVEEVTAELLGKYLKWPR